MEISSLIKPQHLINIWNLNKKSRILFSEFISRIENHSIARMSWVISFIAFMWGKNSYISVLNKFINGKGMRLKSDGTVGPTPPMK